MSGGRGRRKLYDPFGIMRRLSFVRACACRPTPAQRRARYQRTASFTTDPIGLTIPVTFGSISFRYWGDVEPTVACEACGVAFRRRAARQ